MKKLTIAALVAIFLVGCQSTPTTAPVEDKSGEASTAAPGTGGVARRLCRRRHPSADSVR